MTTIHYSGTELFMGAGLICREPGDYTVQDETAELLLKNESELFSLAGEQPAVTEESESVDESSIDNESTDGDAEAPESTQESDVETTDDSQPETDEGVDEDTETDAPEATQEPSEPVAPTKSLSKMNKDELQALAAQIGAEVTAELTADQMREAIKAAQEKRTN